MLRRMIFATVTIMFVLACCFIAFAKSAEKISSGVLYGEKNGSLSLFDIDGKICIAIKDMAVILSDSSKEFDFKAGGDKFIIEKGRKYSGETKLLEIDENTVGYDENIMDFKVGNKNFKCTVYNIDDEYFMNIESLSQIIDFDVSYNSSENDKIYINKNQQEIIDILNTGSFNSAGLVFEDEYINSIREKVRQTFISSYGKENFTQAIQKKLDSSELCHDFKIVDGEFKLKIYTKEITIPYSSVMRYVRGDILNYAVITLLNEDNNEDNNADNKFSESLLYIMNAIDSVKSFQAENSESEETIKEVDANAPVIAFTFDDGPNGETTEKLLDILEKYDAKATFFVVGSRVEKNRDIVKREYDLGCQIGNHSYSHSMLTKLTLEEAKTEINKTSNIVFEVTGDYTRVGRPPYGALNHEIKEASKIDWFNWALDTYDWKTRDTEDIYKRIIENAEDGDIILMHDLYDATVDAVERAVPELAEKGYRFVTIKELIEIKGGADKISGYIRK